MVEEGRSDMAADTATPSAQYAASALARPATMRDVAELAQVSIASVSRVLNGLGVTSDATRQRVLEAVDHLRYVPHFGARSLSTSRIDTIGVILPDLFGEFFSELIRGMDLAARAHGQHLIISSSHDDAKDTLAAVRSMSGRVDGVIFLSPHVAAANLAAEFAGRMPVLLMNAGAADAGRPAIVIDNHGGAVEAVEHLIATGRRRIAHIRGAAGNIEADTRAAGYVAALGGQAPILVEGDFSQASGHRAATQLMALPEPPDAVFAANDMMAVGALLAFQEAGVRCPQDIAVVGFDDVPIAALVRPALTTMRVNIAEIGRRGVEHLIRMVQAGQNAQPTDTFCEIVRPVLVERQSTATASTAAINKG